MPTELETTIRERTKVAFGVPGVESVHVSDDGRIVTVETEHNSEIIAEATSKPDRWLVQVIRTRKHDERSLWDRRVLSDLTYPVDGTLEDALRFGIAFGIGHAYGARFPV